MKTNTKYRIRSRMQLPLAERRQRNINLIQSALTNGGGAELIRSVLANSPALPKSLMDQIRNHPDARIRATASADD